jgi:type VI secretion system protein ImpA
MTLEIDLRAKLSPLPPEGQAHSHPCGPNLEYDPDFLELEGTIQPQDAQEFTRADGSRAVIAGSEQDWLKVRRLSENLLERTRDIRVAICYTRALLHIEGFPGIHVGLNLLLGLVDQYWEHVYPALDADDDNDPTMRINAFAPLVSADEIIADLRASWLLRSRQSGTLTVRDIELTLNKLDAHANEPVLTDAQLTGFLRAALDADPGLADTIPQTLELAHRLSAALQDHVGAHASIDFTPLLDILHALKQAYDTVRPEATVQDTSDSADNDSADSDSRSNNTAPGAPGEIRSRADVIASIERLATYLERTEPTNPAQWLLRRAQRVMQMNFLETIAEFTPEAIEQAERMLGGRLEQPDQPED